MAEGFHRESQGAHGPVSLAEASRYPHGPGSERGRPRTEPWYHVAKAVVLPPLRLWFRLHHEGLERIPRVGPAIVVCNHISYLDPLTNGDAVVRAGRRPRFLAKQELFRIPVVGTALRGAGQIPVARGARDQTSLARAEDALRHGEILVVYPEGTVTTREDRLPMDGKTGVVRLALATNVPIVPMASWGSQAVWQKSGKGSLKFGRPIWTEVGESIDLGARPDVGHAPVRALTADVMEALTRLVVGLRDRYPRRWSG